MASTKSEDSSVSLVYIQNQPQSTFPGGQEHSMLWTVRKLTKDAVKTGQYIESLPMGCDGKKTISFYLRLYPAGEDESSKDFFSLHVMTRGTTDETLTFSYIVSIHADDMESSARLATAQNVSECRISKFMSRQQIWAGKDQVELRVMSYVILIRSFRNNNGIAECRFFHGLNLDSWRFSLAGDMRELYGKSFFSDVTIYANGSPIPAHVCVISPSWPVFKAAISSLEIPPGHRHSVHFEVDSATMGKILFYLYTGEKPVLDEGTALTMLRFSIRYYLPPVKELCVEYIFKNGNSNGANSSNSGDIVVNEQQHEK